MGVGVDLRCLFGQPMNHRFFVYKYYTRNTYTFSLSLADRLVDGLVDNIRTGWLIFRMAHFTCALLNVEYEAVFY